MMRKLSPISALLSASVLALILSSCAQAPKKPTVMEGCWLDETGVQALSVLIVNDSTARIQSQQGMLDGTISGDTISAPTPPPLHETIQMIFLSDTALYRFLGTEQRFYRILGERINTVCGGIPEAAKKAQEEQNELTSTADQEVSES